MSLSRVKQALFRTSLHFDSTMANEVCVFFAQNQINPNQQNIQLLSIVAATIISELKIITSTKNHSPTHNDINIETVMSHLNGYSKEQFLQTVSTIVSSNTALAYKLSSKLNSVSISYRLFKKYRISFDELWKMTQINSLVKNDLLSIFWVVYLLVKNRKSEIFEDLRQQQKLLIVLLKSIFQCWISDIDHTGVQQVIVENFNISNDIDFREQYFTEHRDQYFNEMDRIFKIRYVDESLDMKRFSRNPMRIAKIFNDISNYFFNEKENFQIENYVDEISYLHLQKVNKNLPSDSIKNKVQKELPEQNKQQQLSNQLKQHSQNKVKVQDLDFSFVRSNKNHIISQNLSEITPIRQRKEFIGATPCHNRIENMEWIRNCIDYMNRPEANQTFKKAFYLVEKTSLEKFYEKASEQLLFLVQEFTPKCMRKDKRVNDILAFFKFLVLKIYENHKEMQNTKMFKETKTFSAILCLSSDIFNFSHSSSLSSYKRQCEIFEVPLIEGLKPINWIGKNIEKPHELNDYLYSLEKRIVIQQIWQDETGYNLIKSQQSFHSSYSIGYNDMIVWRRLQKHIYDRIEELSKEVKIEPKLTKKIHELQQRLLKEKPFLLHKNKIDHIVICCITAFLSLNEIQKSPLNNVFQSYNNMDLSSNATKEGLSGNGVVMPLSQYYNKIFLPQIQNILDTDKYNNTLLLTPIRKDRQMTLLNRAQDTLFSRKYEQKPIDSVMGMRTKFNLSQTINQVNSFSQYRLSPNSNSVSTYRKKILQNMKIEAESQNQNSYNSRFKKNQQEKFSFGQPMSFIMQNFTEIRHNPEINLGVVKKQENC